ncbi:MAG: PEGA domain-containing protein [Deltaproteobacteria bacterium]|nr:PEGA domain-containing protein [Deltaproteobacteria bacterium]
MQKALVVVFVALSFCLGCAAMDLEAAGTLTVECNVPEAGVLLDDEVVGRASDLEKAGKSLRPGFYRVELQHPDYYSHFAEIYVPEGGATTVKAELHPRLD